MKIGVIVGRFQTHIPHIGHRALIDYVKERSDYMIVFIGVGHTGPTVKNPLDYESRAHMIKEFIRHGDVLSPIFDNPSDEVWSMNLDEQIRLSVSDGSEVTLYGGRDSFIPYYHGEYKTEFVDINFPESSATNQRAMIAEKSPHGLQERKGAIWAMQKKFTNPIPVVDVICYHGFNDNLIAIGRKKIDGLYRLPGGFIDNDETGEQAAIRELYEETFLVDDEEPILIGTYVVDDWRYNCEPNNLLSLLYVTQAINPNDLDASDDLNEVFWADADFILTNEEKFVKTHFKMINEHFIEV